MAILEWERELAFARVVDWQPVTPGMPAGATLDGVTQTAFLSGGAFWRLSLGGLVLRGRDAILAGQRMKAALTGGRPIVMRPCDCRQAPLGAGESLAGDASPIVATISAAPLRATSATITLVSGSRPLRAGDQFSPTHADWGLRLHRIDRIAGGTDDAPEVEFSPPLRAAVTEGQAVDFNRPGCTMRLSTPFQITTVLRGRLLNGEAGFCELERPLTAAELAA